MSTRSCWIGLCLVLATGLASTGLAQVPPEMRHAFRINPEDGCYRYTGDAIEFTGMFRKSSYVGIVMRTLDAAGQPMPEAEETRTPAMDAPLVASTAPETWFGPLATGGLHTITFIPCTAFGSSAHVVICGRMHPPRR